MPIAQSISVIRGAGLDATLLGGDRRPGEFVTLVVLPRCGVAMRRTTEASHEFQYMSAFRSLIHTSNAHVNDNSRHNNVP